MKMKRETGVCGLNFFSLYYKNNVNQKYYSYLCPCKQIKNDAGRI